jgi:RNA polymerase sigma factor (sigma-70 family)
LTVANREVVTDAFVRASIAVVDDDELLSRARRDPEAFGAFYERHERLVLGFFMRRTRDSELAADLAAETFAVALVASRKYRGEGAPASAWLIGIARNTLFASLRRSRVEDRARRRLGMQPIELDDELLARIERLGGDSRVEALLGRLTPEQSDAVRARVLEEEEYGEIALRLRCSESVVRQRVHRGLAMLRRIHEEEAI